MEHHTRTEIEAVNKKLHKRGLAAAAVLLWLQRNGLKKTKVFLRREADMLLSRLVRSGMALDAPIGRVLPVFTANANSFESSALAMIAELRSAARAEASVQAKAQLEVVDAALGSKLADRVVMTQAAYAEDMARSYADAKALASKWLAIAVAMAAQGEKLERIPDKTVSLIDVSMKRTSVTATASAFGAELIAEFDEAESYATEGVKLGKRWESALEANTCKVCEGMHGTIVPVDESFPGGLIPGHVHHRCQCIPVLVVM